MPAKLTQQQFIIRSQQRHGDRYDYSQVVYVNNLKKVNIICKEHGMFPQQPNHHMDGRGCPKCKTKSTVARFQHTLNDFLLLAKKVHGDFYDYSKAVYKKSSIKIDIYCPIHGLFRQTPNNHISKRAGCPKCAGKSMTTQEFIERAVAIHSDTYRYERTEYYLIKKKVAITCQKHGDFFQNAEAHLIGHGCPQCWKESCSSKTEQELSQWIESLGLSVIRNDRTAIAAGLEIDIYIPSLKTGIEYNGCYWHSDKVNKNLRKHEFKHQCAKADGIRLITVWDYDWQHRKDIVRQHLRHALNLNSDPPINARSCTVAPISSADANRLYTNHHLQGPCRGGVLHIGLHHNNVLVAAMSFTQGATRRGKTGTGEWELARYATAALVRGGASRLFRYFIQHTDATTVWSFSDRQHFDGGLYPILGFIQDGELPADYKVVKPSSLTVWHKSLWQRKSIPQRLRELGLIDDFDPATDPRTEQHMQNQAGVLRVWDAGKIRWLWTKKPEPA